ncbi:hypothetical protein, partial [Arachidicoccus sp.]|uniref:hypothetical protein n=1 Tax=Arachidicoccus sp. TaxID=1872624 RepID=UPI003D24ABB1
HIKLITIKATRKLYCLGKALKSSSTNFLLNMYKTYVRSILESSCQVYNPWLKKDIVEIEKVQKRAFRWIWRKSLQKRFPDRPGYKTMLKILNMESLEDRRVSADLLLFHQIKTGKVKIDDAIVPKEYRENSRRGTLKLPFARKNYISQSFIYRAAELYPRIPLEIKTLKTNKAFRKSIHSFLQKK